ncbi:DUF3426 domain-containing protein [Microbulbifer epialgicus]|uniref:DUF3426 domain-containing protein n=1 Tax=Microbulbifer epialgicus TaxID=393907 RepID=A0ABV4NYU4_9GAMM
MSQLVTRCPHCSTSFHINDQQLRAARGAVRCGSCLQVFRADENIVFTDESDNNRSDLEALLEDDDFLIHDDIELGDEEPAPPKQLEPSPVAKEEKVEKHPQAVEAENVQSADEERGSNSLIGDAFGDNEWQELQEEAVREEPEEDLESVLKPDWNDIPDFDHRSVNNNDDNSNTSLYGDNFENRDPWEQSLESQATATEALDPAPTIALDLSTQETLPPQASVANGRREPFFASSAETNPDSQVEPEREQLISAIQPAPLEMSWGVTPQKKVLPSWLWWLLLPLLTTTLLAQIAYFQFDTLSKKQPWRNIYASACPLFDCRLPQLRDLNAIQATNLMVRSHPQLEGALVVDAVLVNTADYSQPFPNLLLNFSDLKNREVASRRFSPEEYLQGELAGRKLMPQDSPIHIAIEVVDPGAEAVNYEMKITR